MPSTRGIALLAVLLEAAGCATGERGESWTEIDSAGVRIVQNRRPTESWTLAAEPDIVLGDDDGPNQFFQVRSIAFLPGDRFAVANAGTEQVRFFTTRGEFLGEVGRSGNGPDEFRFLSWIAVQGDSLLIYDSGNDRIAVRNLSGEVARTFRLSWFSGSLVPVLALSDGTFLSVTGVRMTELQGQGTITDTVLVSRYDRTGARLDSLTRIPLTQRVRRDHDGGVTVLPPPFSASGELVGAAGGFCHFFGTRLEVTCRDLRGAPTLLIRLPTAPRLVEPSDIDWFWDTGLAGGRGAADMNPFMAEFFRRDRESIVFPDTFPGFEHLLGDDVGRVWAQSYRIPRDSMASWDVFESGHWIARLAVPTAFRVMAIAGERVIGVWTDDLGVESIRLYRIAEG